MPNYDNLDLSLRSDTEEFQKTKMVDELQKGIGNNIKRLIELCERSGMSPQRAYIACFTAAGNDTDVILLHKLLSQILEEDRQNMEESLRAFSKGSPTEIFRLAEMTGLVPEEVVKIIKTDGTNPYALGLVYNSMLSRLKETTQNTLVAQQMLGDYKEEKSKSM